MVTVNFFDDAATELVEKFCDYFELDKEEVLEYFINVDPDTLRPETFVRKFGLDINKYDSSQLQIVCRHMTTSTEEGVASFKEKGLLDLRTMLQEESPLSTFLSQHKIKVYVDEHRMDINGKNYLILEAKDVCPVCYKGRERTCTSKEGCECFKEISYMASKLYEYEATVEYFIYATMEGMKRYSTVDSCPEILNNLDKIIAELRGQYEPTYDLCYDWVAKNGNCYVIEFASPWSEMETYNPINYRDAYREYECLLTSCGYSFEDYMEKNIPKRVYDNIAFLKLFVSIYFYDSEEYGSLLGGGFVPADRLKFYHVVGNNLVEMNS